MNVRNQNIQFIRIISMSFILLCHLFNEIGNRLSVLSQAFNVGVFIFFIISAYLYGKKDINNEKEWILKKVLQIMLPIYFWLFFMNIVYIVMHSPVNYHDNLWYLLNLQVFHSNSLIGLGHLWFTTMIMCMYLITLFVNKKKDIISRHIFLFTALLISLFLITSYVNQDIGRFFFYIMLYVGVYIYSYQTTENNKHIDRIRLITLILLGGG